MNPELAKLKDIHLPQAVNMWPTTPGWIMLIVVLSGLLVYLIYFLWQRKKRRYTIKFALQQLNQLRKLMQHNQDDINIAAEISTLIRRAALYYFQRNTIAGLYGQDWLKFLNESGNTTQFTADVGQILIDAPYRKINSADLTPLFLMTQNWLETIAKLNRKEN